MEVELEKVGINRKDRIINIASLTPLIAFADERIFQVCKKLAESGHRSLPVVDKKLYLKGIVTITDIFGLFLSEGNLNSSVDSIMSREVISCDVEESIEDVLIKMKISKRGRLPVTQNKKVVGMISETDFLLATKETTPFEDIKIEEVMVKKPFFVTPNFNVREVMRTMVNGKYRRLPIVENGMLVGYITSTSLLKYLVVASFSEESLNRKISDVMTKNPITVSRQERLSNVLRKMKERKISSMLIADEKRLNGIFTERDYINLLV
jgi:CBS domain-containing protein